MLRGGLQVTAISWVCKLVAHIAQFAQLCSVADLRSVYVRSYRRRRIVFFDQGFPTIRPLLNASIISGCNRAAHRI
jgi:hypothetical protein